MNTSPELIDTHCHLDLGAFDSDRGEVLQRAKASGVSKFIVPGVTRLTWSKLVTICASNQALYPALGLHPLFTDQHQESDLVDLEQWIVKAQPVAIGEIGLDFHIASTDRDKQLAVFESQLKIASKANLPVICHVRKAHDPVLKQLRKHKLKGGICHAFNGSLQQANQYIELGFKLGFGGMLTYDRSTRLRKLAAALPLEAIVLETDAPDMTGAAHQHQRNSPEYLPEILHTLASVKKVDPDSVATQTTSNALEVISGLAT